MKNEIKNKIDQVSNNLSSIFTKEDVIKLLNDLNEELKDYNVPLFEKHELLDAFREAITDKDFDDVVDVDDIELNLNHENCIEITRVPIDESMIIDNAYDVLEECWDELVKIYQTEL
jgi:hypothetical protein